MKGEFMTQMLKNAFAEAALLPEADQNALAEWLIEEIRSERRWSEAFADSQDMLEQMADEALAEKRRGRTTPLDINQL
jgi:hypothetical protein